MLQQLAKEREDRAAKDKATLSDTNSAPVTHEHNSQPSNVKTMADVMTNKQKKKQWVASKKKKNKGRGGLRFLAENQGMSNRGTGRGGQTSGYREIPIPRCLNLERTESQEVRAAIRASCAESRIDPVELAATRRTEGDR